MFESQTAIPLGAWFLKYLCQGFARAMKQAENSGGNRVYLIMSFCVIFLSEEALSQTLKTPDMIWP